MPCLTEPLLLTSISSFYMVRHGRAPPRHAREGGETNNLRRLNTGRVRAKNEALYITSRMKRCRPRGHQVLRLPSTCACPPCQHRQGAGHRRALACDMACLGNFAAIPFAKARPPAEADLPSARGDRFFLAGPVAEAVAGGRWRLVAGHVCVCTRCVRDLAGGRQWPAEGGRGRHPSPLP